MFAFLNQYSRIELAQQVQISPGILLLETEAIATETLENLIASVRKKTTHRCLKK
jgi:hypothetical protein